MCFYNKRTNIFEMDCKGVVRLLDSLRPGRRPAQLYGDPIILGVWLLNNHGLKVTQVGLGFLRVKATPNQVREAMGLWLKVQSN